MAFLLHVGWRFLKTRAGLVLVACGLLWTWHLHDRRQAVDAAREGYVRAYELSAVEAELEGMRRRMAAAKIANQTLREKVQAAEGQAMRFQSELEAYERETQVNPDGTVDADLLRRLRAN